MASIRVHTTQNVTLEYQVASLGDRIVATIIDNLVFVAWAAVVALVVFKLLPLPETVAAWTMGILVGVPYVFYNLASEIFLNGQSIGKKARDIRVVRLDGTAPRVGDYFLRWLLRVVDMFFYGVVAMVTIAANGKGQRLGDLAAGTSVISLKARPVALPDAASLVTPVGYQPVFAQAANLTDHDATLLHQLLDRALKNDNYELLHETAVKIKGLLAIHTDLDDAAFLRTVLRDHAHLLYEGDIVR